MSPRTYKLGRRAATASATRQRILEAAIETYRDVGVRDASLSAVAARANVARGTILHHFGSAQGLLGAVLDEILDRLEVPDERIFEGLSDPNARIRAFMDAMIAFQERSAPWWPIFESEMALPEVRAREVAYWDAFGRLQAAALGPELAGNPMAGASIVALSHPATAGTFAWAFERAGVAADRARELLGELAVDAVRRVADADAGSGS